MAGPRLRARIQPVIQRRAALQNGHGNADFEEVFTPEKRSRMKTASKFEFSFPLLPSSLSLSLRNSPSDGAFACPQESTRVHSACVSIKAPYLFATPATGEVCKIIGEKLDVCCVVM